MITDGLADFSEWYGATRKHCNLPMEWEFYDRFECWENVGVFSCTECDHREVDPASFPGDTR